MSGLTYEALVRELFPRLTGGIRWGLERTRAMLAEVGDPHQSFRSVHVGGTNGKGSVAATLAAILAAAGRRTGLYSSPHLCSFRERIQIQGEPVSEAALLDAAARLWPAIERVSPSFFEATTAIAFLALADAGVETAVIEVGLGGRLDATNVIAPELAVITNIALDHAEYLGNTIASVAREKAGIVKRGVPLLTGEDSDTALRVFRARTEAVGSTLHRLDAQRVRAERIDLEGARLVVETDGWGRLDLHTPLIGAHQVGNTALAVRAAELLPDDLRPQAGAVVEGVRGVRWPGRLQRERVGEQLWLLDVAHNVAGVHALVAALRALELPRPLIVVIGILGDKDWQAMLPPLASCADATLLTVPPTAPPARAWQPEEVLRAVELGNARVVANFASALEQARVEGGRGTVLITGSFHTVGDALIALDRAPFGSDTALPHLTFSG